MYILQLTYPNVCVFYKTNMLLPYYMISSISEPSTTFSVSHNCVTCNCDIYHTYVMHNIILHLLSKFKIKKSENKNQK